MCDEFRWTFGATTGVRDDRVGGPVHVYAVRAAKVLAFGKGTFRHPGKEWGTGFAFDAPGCWSVEVARTGTVATVGILVT